MVLQIEAAMKRVVLLVIVLLGSILNIHAQDEKKPSPVTISAYADLYYSYDFSKPTNHARPSFIYSYNRHHEVNVNLGYVKVSYNTERVRANVALAAGTYMNANYAAEPGLLKNVLKANAGIKLSKKSNLWLDVGVFGSHLGVENPVGKDCWAMTRSMGADNSPYFETGVKLGYTSPNEQWFFSVLYLNGWQRITRPDGNSTPAFGTQITFKPSANITLNSSAFIGNDKPDSVKQMRYFHDFYGIFQLSKKWATTLGIDAGWEQKSKGSSEMNSWIVPLVLLRYTPTAKVALCGRAEYFGDENGVIIASGTPNGFKTWGFSANVDLNITSNVMWRNEVRTFSSMDDVFMKGNNMVSNNTAFTTSMVVAF